ncbi:MAG: substrate-binding domain-containing protein [Brevinematales bacterium]|nr:substrate-binding domain-containing protein [Brevinematales bacterium]
MVEKRSVTIGVFLDRVNTSYHEEVIRGIIDFAKKNNINLFIFITGWYNSLSLWEKSENILFKYCKSNLLDGIIMFSSIGQIDSIEKLYYSMFPQDKPAFVIGRNLENLPSVSVDNQKGISILLEHLIKEHGYRRIAFLKGPAHNKEACERLETYLKIMKDNGIKIDPHWLIEGDFLTESGKLAAEFIVNRLNMEIDVVVCANDMMAFGLIEELRRRNFKVPEDLKVVGFDDINISGSYHLTTVHQPFYSIGYVAIKNLYEKIKYNDKKVEKTMLIPNIILRNSCGCNIRRGEDLFKNIISNEKITEILKKYENFIPINEILIFFKEFDFEEDSFISYLEHKKISVFVLKELACFIEKELPFMSKILKEYIDNKFFITDFEFKNNLLKINEIGENILIFNDSGEKFEYLFNTFPDIGIDSTYVSFYEKSLSGIDFSRLIFAFDRYGKFKIPENGIRYMTYDILPVDFLPREEFYHYFVYNLFHEENIGQVLFKIGDLNLNLYEVIKNKIAFSLTNKKDIKKELEYIKISDNEISVFLTDLQFNTKAILIESELNLSNLNLLISEQKINLTEKTYRKLKIENKYYHLICIPIEQRLLWIIINEDLIDFEKGFDELEIEILSQKYKLTKKEKQILEMIVKGLQNKEIADKLFISENTVKNYTNKIYSKLEVKNRKEMLTKVKKDIS